MGSFSLWHWLVVIILVMLLFGRGRISGTMGEIGKGLKSFKQGLSEDDDERYRRYSEQRSAGHEAQLSGEQASSTLEENPPETAASRRS